MLCFGINFWQKGNGRLEGANWTVPFFLFHPTLEYYLAIKRNKIGPFIKTRMDQKCVIQSEVNQKEKNKYHVLRHKCAS